MTASSEQRPDLVLWFDAPPRAGAGAFGYVTRHWGGRVFYLCARPTQLEGRDGAWQASDPGRASVVILSEQADKEAFIESFLGERPDAIHLCNGFRSMTSPYVRKYLFNRPAARIAMWSERPGVWGTPLRKICRRCSLPLLYRFYARRYGKVVRAMLPLGTVGVETFARFGWDRDILFPFMYDPEEPATAPEPAARVAGSPLKFLYVGRFARSTKGIDILMRAVDGLAGEWRLDLVGGYGEYRGRTISWARKHRQVSFLGTWPSTEVCRRMAGYDVCIVPSRFDGWNVIPNEAIRAGVGVIVTDQAVSHDLIGESGAGVVVPACDLRSLRQAMQGVIDDPSQAELWKDAARAFAPRISSAAVGGYLIDVLSFTFGEGDKPRPRCPWL